MSEFRLYNDPPAPAPHLTWRRLAWCVVAGLLGWALILGGLGMLVAAIAGGGG